MEINFKFEIGQYVRLTDEFLKCNDDFPKYPCKIDYRFFDGKNNVYVIEMQENKRCVLEEDLKPYIEHHNHGIIHQMQKTICELQDRIANLEFKIDRKST